MLARLWWKEWRAFAPAWLILGLAAAGLQWLFLTTNAEDVRSGALTPAALGWAVLYAFAAGAAAFAGEREARTLEFLDALPVARPALWLGKSTFALASTLGLALALAALAALGTRTRDPAGSYGYGPIVRIFGTLLFEAVAWSLLWSSLSKNPLLAGAMAVVSVGGMSLFSNWATPVDLESEWKGTAIRLAAAAAALVISALTVTWRPRPAWTFRDDGSARAPGTVRPGPASAARSLDWQTWREGWPTGLLVATVGLVVPMTISALGSRSEVLVEMVLAVMASLVAGVSVFGPENAAGTRRFLVHHGVSPGLVWWRKLLIWGVAMAAFLAVFLVSFAWHGFPANLTPGPGPHPGFRLPLASAVLDAFAVGVLCGMAIRRRITAALVGAIGVLATAPMQAGLASLGMIPAWSPLLTPAILLAVSRAWAGDWLAEREGARPWARLGLLLAVPAGLLGLTYVAYRAWGVPDVGPVFDPVAARAEVVPPGQNAAEVYRRAIAEVRPFPDTPRVSDEVNELIERGWDPGQARVVAWWEQDRGAIDLARRASTMPRARFAEVDRMTYVTQQDGAVTGLGRLALLLALDARERMARGDLTGAWEDILAQFRMADQLAATTPTILQMLVAAQIHHRAVGLAFDWAGDPRQTPESIRAAREDLKRVPPLPSLAASLRVESLLLDRTFDLSADELDRVLNSGSGSHRSSVFERLMFARVIAPWWERQRARRICRRLIAEQLPDADREPWQRAATGARFDRTDATFEGSPLARLLHPWTWSAVDALDRETARRRALDLALALRSWQLGHGGAYPVTLEALVPGELDRLPLDPYSGRPFGYVRSGGQAARPPILADEGPPSDLRPTRPGQFLLYSVGPDRKDDRGERAYEFRGRRDGDLLYPLP